MSKKSYLDDDIIQEIYCAIELLCEEQGYATPSSVIRLLKIEENALTRTIVRDIACNNINYYVKSSGRGYRILSNWIDDNIPF